MNDETHRTDCKSLRLLTGGDAGWRDLAADCVCFANAAGGLLLIGIEDGERLPPPAQRVAPEMLDRLRRRIGELTVNVEAAPQRVTASNGGEYIELTVARSTGVASTQDGRYFVRVGDSCQPVVGDDVLRLLTDRPGSPWESLVGLQIAAAAADVRRCCATCCAGCASPTRVKPSVKEKSDAELLLHYGPPTARCSPTSACCCSAPRPSARGRAVRRWCRRSSTTSAVRRSTSGRGTTTRCRRWN
ncbi:MAG: putative DNA binding domain-containing protein [Rubrivivax sp.]